MSAVEGPDPHREIIIVRRGGHDEHDDHHGGVWKIAFADFMTAMMCFFLVMWLINAANEETKAAVASYFNPIKLVDRNASRKGLEDVGDGAGTPGEEFDNNVAEPLEETAGEGPKVSGASSRNQAPEAADDDKHSDAHLFSNPYAVLAEIAQQTGTMQNMSVKGEGGAQDAGPATGASGGEAFRDPFAPDFWSQQVIPENQTSASAEPSDEMEPEIALERAPLAAPQQDQLQPATAEPAPAVKEPGPDASAEVDDKLEATEEWVEKPKPEAPEIDPQAARIAETIREQIHKEFGASEKILEGMTVEATPEGVVISVTDQLDFGMFEIGSAVPRRDLVLAMEKISRIVSGQPGSVKINGHTDGRPFSSKTYDNWRLSTARAHSAYYMLVRGGLDENRIVEVAGFADRKLKVESDPYAASNRRIEILLEAGE